MKKKLEEIKKIISETIELKKEIQQENYLKNIYDIAQIIFHTLKKDKKILLCGNGGSAADCQHWVGEMIGRFKKERKSLRFISLTTNTSTLTSISNDYSYDYVFARQVEGIGEKGDILICISTSGKSNNIIKAAKLGKNIGMKIISLTGKSPNPLSEISDYNISVPSIETPRIQEVHILLIHLICGIVEEEFTANEN